MNLNSLMTSSCPNFDGFGETLPVLNLGHFSQTNIKASIENQSLGVFYFCIQTSLQLLFLVILYS